MEGGYQAREGLMTILDELSKVFGTRKRAEELAQQYRREQENYKNWLEYKRQPVQTVSPPVGLDFVTAPRSVAPIIFTAPYRVQPSLIETAA